MIGYDSIKEQIRQRLDLVDFISRDVALKRKGRDFGGLCPFHQEKTPSFYVSPDKGIFKCFGCGAGGDLFSYVQRRENVEFGEAVRMLADRCGIELRKESRRSEGQSGPAGAKRPTRHDILKANQWAADAFRSAYLDEQTGAAARQYVADRGISAEFAESFGIGLAIDDGGWLLNRARSAGISEQVLAAAVLVRTSDRPGGIDGANRYGAFRNRLMFPIRDTMNRVLGFGGRTLGDDKAKYINTSQNPVFDKRRLLYGIDLAREKLAETRRAIVVEGYTDCIAAHQAGFANTVATLGTALTDEHVSLLRRWCDEIVLVFDADQAGQQAADRAVEVALRFDVSVRIVRLSDGKDPCEILTRLGATAFEEMLNGAVDALGFRWEALCRRYRAGASVGGSSGGGSTGANAVGVGRSEAVREFIRLTGDLLHRHSLDAIQRGLIVNQLSRLMGLGPGEVNQLLKQAAKKAAAKPRQVDNTLADNANAGNAAPIGNAPASDGFDSGTTGHDDGGFVAEDDSLADAEQAALDAVLVVLINEPGHFAAVEKIFDPERFRDPRRKRIGRTVTRLCRELGEFGVTELMDALDDPSEASLVTDLAYRGASMGSLEETINLDETISGCVARLKQLESQRRVRQAADQLSASSGSEQDDRLAQISRDQANASSFGGRQVQAAWSKHCIK